MKKTIFEQMGGTYTKVGYYYLPNPLYPLKKKLKLACGDNDICGILNNTTKCDTLIC